MVRAWKMFTFLDLSESDGFTKSLRLNDDIISHLCTSQVKLLQLLRELEEFRPEN